MKDKGKPGPDKIYTARLRDVRLTATARARLGIASKESGKSVSELVRAAVDEYLAKQDKE